MVLRPTASTHLKRIRKAHPLAALEKYLDQHLAGDQGISEPHAAARATFGDLVLKAHPGFCGVLPAPSSEELLNEGLAHLLLVAAAAGNPLGEAWSAC
jgi:hypothetical protein